MSQFQTLDDAMGALATSQIKLQREMIWEIRALAEDVKKALGSTHKAAKYLEKAANNIDPNRPQLSAAAIREILEAAE